MPGIVPSVSVSTFKDQANQEAISGDTGGFLDQDTIDELDGLIAVANGALASNVGKHNRLPFIFTRVGESENGIFIYASLNPTDISYTIPLREVMEKCGGGEVKHVAQASAHRAENLGRFIDEIDIRYTLTTGNCLPIRLSGGELGVPAGLNTFYELLSLILEADRVLPDGRANDFIVFQNSVPFPMLTVEGKIKPEGVSFSESAQSPSEIAGVSFSLSVHKTMPRLTSVQSLIGAWTSGAPAIGRK